MKKSLLMSIVCMGLFNAMMAQDDAYSHNRKEQKTQITEQVAVITIDFFEIAYDKALEEIARHFDIGLAINPQLLPKGKFSRKLQDVTLSEALLRILEDTDVEAFISPAGNIMLRRKENKKNSLLKGHVIDQQTQEPLPGATIQVRGTNLGTVADAEGYFSIPIPDEVELVLVVSFVGYESAVITVTSADFLNVQLKPSVSSLNEVVVIGYGTQERNDMSTSVASIKSTEFKDMPVSGFDQALAGKLAGVRIAQTTGSPGAGITVRIRGTGSITAGNDPLYVVDGVPVSNRMQYATGYVNNYYDSPINPLNTININDIESIDVLKDASAAAIYGSRGANGVVLITTKKGKAGRSRVSYDMYYGLQNVSKKIDMLNAYEYAKLNFDGHNNTYLDNVAGASVNDPNSIRNADEYKIPPEVVPYVNGVKGLTNTNWQDAIFRTAAMQSHTISISGGKEKMKYYASGTYLDQQGIVINSSYTQYSARFNMEVTDNRLHFGVNLSPSYSMHNRVKAEGPYWAEGVVGTALVYAPIFPVYNSDGSFNYDNNAWGYSHTSFLNPVALAKLTENKVTQTRLLGSMFVEYELFKGLKYRLNVGADMSAFDLQYYWPSTLEIRNQSGPSNPTGRARTEYFLNYLAEHTFSYQKTIGKHSLQALAGFTAQKELQQETYLTARNYPNDFVHSLNEGLVTDGGSKNTKWSLLSYLGRLQYDFSKKYMVSLAIRADGSSKFGPGNRWGYFPSASAAWRISAEPFMSNVKSVNELKIRSSYGLTGNFDIGTFDWLTGVGGVSYPLGAGGGTIVNGIAQNSIGNKDLRWEKTGMLNVGVDIGLLNDKVMLVADYYNSNTKDLLLDVPVPRISGTSRSLQNIGKVNNHGIEFTVRTRNKIGKLEWEASVNIATNKNKVIALGPESDTIITRGGDAGALFITTKGKPMASYYTLVRKGIFKNEAELEQYPHFADARPGDAKIIDANHDGRITLDGDRTITGSYFPNYTFGITNTMRYNNIDLSFTIQGVEGNKVFNLMRRYIYNMEGNMNNVKGALKRWNSEEDPGDGKTIRANRIQTTGNANESSWHIEDGSFIRIRNITLGYSIPKQVLSRVKMTNARVYAAAQNPFTFTKYSGYNPEVSGKYLNNNALVAGEDYGTYPLAKVFSIGLNITY